MKDVDTVRKITVLPEVSDVKEDPEKCYGGRYREGLDGLNRLERINQQGERGESNEIP